jgi:hypothetical protein
MAYLESNSFLNLFQRQINITILIVLLLYIYSFQDLLLIDLWLLL